VDCREAQPKPVKEVVLSNRGDGGGMTGAGGVHRPREQKA